MSFDEARRRVADLIQELAPDIGPRRGVEGEIYVDDPEAEPVESALLVDWVLVCAWVDPADAEPFIVRMSSETLAEYQRDGLLLSALKMG